MISVRFAQCSVRFGSVRLGSVRRAHSDRVHRYVESIVTRSPLLRRRSLRQRERIASNLIKYLSNSLHRYFLSAPRLHSQLDLIYSGHSGRAGRAARKMTGPTRSGRSNEFSGTELFRSVRSSFNFSVLDRTSVQDYDRSFGRPGPTPDRPGPSQP